VTNVEQLIALLRSIRRGLGPQDGVVNTEDVDQALKLAEEVRDERTPPAPEGVSVVTLQLSPVGTVARDSTGDLWYKTGPDLWDFNEFTNQTSRDLDHIWGPITIEETD